MIKSRSCHIVLIIFTFIILINGCKGKDKVSTKNQIQNPNRESIKNLPERIKKLKNLTVYSPTKQAADTVKFERKQVFESSKDVLINGYIGEVTVDDQNRVYIEAAKMRVNNIYVFGPNGKYLKSIGRYGRGPGEYEAIGSLKARNKKLYILDEKLQKITIFSLIDFKQVKDIIIRRNKLKNTDALAKRMKGYDLFIAANGMLILNLRMLSLSSKGDIPKNLYYKLSQDGMIMPGMLLEAKRFQFYFFKNKHGVVPPVVMPFTRGTLVSTTRDGHFFIAWTEDFLIREYDRDGNYIRAFYYPVEKSKLSVDKWEKNPSFRDVLGNYEMPETWPALYAMKLDDKGRLWVATITNSKTTLRWWVLNQQGKLLARFTFKGDRSSADVQGKPFFKIKNGFFYTHEQDIRAGVDRIVKYKITFKKK